jgi:hypothetical protein
MFNTADIKTPEMLKVEVAKAAQDKINAEAKQYLASTDWELLRELDGGVAMTAEVKQLRADARARVI